MGPILDAVKRSSERTVDIEKYTDAIRLAGCIMVGGEAGEAARIAEAKGWKRVADALTTKATIAGTTAGTSGMSMTLLLSAIMARVANIGVVDRIAQDAIKVPDRFTGRVGLFSSIAASSIAEGAAKTLKYLSLTLTDFTPVKTVAQVVMTDEAITSLGDEGLRMLGRELTNSVAVGSDSAFLGALTGQSGEAQGTDDWAGIMLDVEELLRDLNLGAGSKPYLIVTPGAAKAIAIRGMTQGLDLSWNGLELGGIPVLASDAQTPGRFTAVDATGLVIQLGEIELRSTGQALVEMVDSSSQSSVPTVTAVSMVSMFQTNSKAIRCERSLAVKAIRTGSYAHLTGVALGTGYDSPQSTPA